MSLSYPENTVWYIEARPWSGTEDNPGFAPANPTSMGSGVVVTSIRITKTAEGDEQREARSYILTCAHVVRDRSDCLLEDIICYPPGKGFIGTMENSRRSGTFENARVRAASVSKYSPCKGEPGPRPDDLKNDPASDWVLLEIDDPTFRHQPSVKALLREDELSADATLQVTGFPGGDITWTNGDMVSPATAEGFRLRGDSTPGILDYEGPEETRAGMSGCGIFDEKGTLVGIHQSYTDIKMKRSGVRVDGIIQQLRLVHHVEFAAGLRSSPLPADRILRAGQQLNDLDSSHDLGDSYVIARSELKRMKTTEISSGDEELLEKIQNATDQPDELKLLVHHLKSLDRKSKGSKGIVEGPDYVRLAKQLEKGEVIFCFGQETSYLLGASVPSTAEIKKILNQENFTGPLSELCERRLIAPFSSRGDLVTELWEMLEENSPSVAVYKLLAELEVPFVVVSACYDNLLQQCLRATEKKFVEIYPDIKRKKCQMLYSTGELLTCLPEDVSAEEPLAKGYTVIYQLRGGIIKENEQLFLAERDYFVFNEVMGYKQEKKGLFPDYIANKLGSSLVSLWFMGHHPESWEERMMIRFLKDLQHNEASAIAVQENAPSFDRDFWGANNVRLYDVPLAGFVQKLEGV